MAAAEIEFSKETLSTLEESRDESTIFMKKDLMEKKLKMKWVILKLQKKIKV